MYCVRGFFVPLDISQVFFCYRNNKLFQLYEPELVRIFLRQYEAVEYICFFFCASVFNESR